MQVDAEVLDDSDQNKDQFEIRERLPDARPNTDAYEASDRFQLHII